MKPLLTNETIDKLQELLRLHVETMTNIADNSASYDLIIKSALARAMPQSLALMRDDIAEYCPSLATVVDNTILNWEHILQGDSECK